MIITISGTIGSGKSTVAKILAKRLGYRHHSTGDFMRKIADEKGITLIELQKVAEKEQWVDKELDERQRKLGQEEDKVVIDGRLSWKFIPHSVKIYLDVSDQEAANRLWKDRDQRKTEGFDAFDDLIKKIQQRKASEIKRYKEYYGVSHHDPEHYDLVIDTTPLSAEEVVERIAAFLDKKH